MFLRWFPFRIEIRAEHLNSQFVINIRIVNSSSSKWIHSNVSHFYGYLRYAAILSFKPPTRPSKPTKPTHPFTHAPKHKHIVVYDNNSLNEPLLSNSQTVPAKWLIFILIAPKHHPNVASLTLNNARVLFIGTGSSHRWNVLEGKLDNRECKMPLQRGLFSESKLD